MGTKSARCLETSICADFLGSPHAFDRLRVQTSDMDSVLVFSKIYVFHCRGLKQACVVHCRVYFPVVFRVHVPLGFIFFIVASTWVVACWVLLKNAFFCFGYNRQCWFAFILISFTSCFRLCISYWGKCGWVLRGSWQSCGHEVEFTKRMPWKHTATSEPRFASCGDHFADHDCCLWGHLQWQLRPYLLCVLVGWRTVRL